MSVEIRSATPDDAAAIDALATELGYPDAGRGLGERLATILGTGGHRVLVAVAVDGSVIGWAHVFVALRVESAPYAEIGGMVVAERHRGGGVGSRLLGAAEHWAASAGVATLRVRSRVARERTRAFYERRGYALTKEQRVFDKRIAAGGAD